MNVTRALLSVYDKTGIADFAEGLRRLGVELLASGGTAKLLQDAGIEVTPIESLTGFAEMLGHRVVTLHPAIHGGILARRDVEDDLRDLEQHGIAPIDLVCVNLYPFAAVAARHGVRCLILRGVSVLGINSATCPEALRRRGPGCGRS